MVRIEIGSKIWSVYVSEVTFPFSISSTFHSKTFNPVSVLTTFLVYIIRLKSVMIETVA